MLNEREMTMAKELARELSVIHLTDEIIELTTFESTINELKSIIAEAWFSARNGIMEIFESIYIPKKKKEHFYNWHVPVKISPSPMPDIKIPKLQLARSNL